MRVTLLAHIGHPADAHAVWSRWDLDPVVLVGLLAGVALYVRGRTLGRRPHPTSDGRFALGLIAVVLAVQSPLDRVAAALASAHMVQHMLLIVVAAPLLASPAALRTVARGMPRLARARAAVAGSHLWPPRRRRHHAGIAGAAAASALSLWLWHSPVLYEAALRNDAVHALEHGTLLATALMFWLLVARRPRPSASAEGGPILILFAMTMQSAFLALLLTFAPAPWYEPYRVSAPAWGREALADQHLAGVIMWVPAGMVYVAAAVKLLVRWLSGIERATAAPLTRYPTAVDPGAGDG